MASIVFIAVQCCQCSTMQVKQKKNSSNKWTCVVCNQKQSERKIFAQGYMAKDLRKFVQSFNMSRKLADDCREHESLTPISSPFDSGLLEDQQRERRSDWSEYLDAEEDGNKENIKEELEEGKEENNYQPEKVISASKRSAEDYNDQRKTQPTIAARVSKWNAYINNDHDDDTLEAGNKMNFVDGMDHCGLDIWDTILDDEKVEDDIHPDFI